MSFVPLQGQATWVPQQPARLSEVEFSGPRRTVRMPLKGAIPVLTRAVRVEDAHPSVGLLSGATLLAMRLVAAGRVRRTEAGDAWRIGPLQPDDDDRVRALAGSRTHPGTTVEDAEQLIRELLDAVADTMVKPPGTALPPVAETGLSQRVHWSERLAARAARGEPEPDGLPDKVRIAMRVEAPEEVLAGGGVVVVPQAHDLDDETVFVDVARLWHETPETHGFSARARLSASVALGEAAEAWEPLGRLLRERVPEQMVLDAEELTGLLDHGLEALDAVGVDVFWPRGLRGELVPQGRVEVSRPREGPLDAGLFGPDSLFGFDWRLALAGQQLSDEEMVVLAEATTPVIRLRDNWVVIDPRVARRARTRVRAGLDRADRVIAPAAALQAALTGTLHLDGGAMQVHPGATLERVRDRIVDAATVSPLPDPPGLRATLRGYQRHGVT